MKTIHGQIIRLIICLVGFESQSESLTDLPTTPFHASGDAVVTSQDDRAPNGHGVIKRAADDNQGTGIIPNDGLTGAWHNPAIPGQGLMVDIKTEIDLFFAAWFTYDNEQPGALRWLTVQGALGSGTNIEATVYNTTNGLFNALSETETVPVGTAEIHFLDCSTAVFSFQIDGGPSGSIELERSVPNVYCE